MNNNDIIIQETSRKDIVCFNSRKHVARTLGNAQAKTVGLLLLLACFLPQGRATAGERAFSGQNNPDSFGYLRVFSSTQESQWGEGSYYYPHTGYRIYDANGRTVKWVENHITSTDEDPEKVELAPGAYTIWAQSDKVGYVKVPVVIKPAQAMAIHLESDRESDREKTNPAKAVTTSSGRIVGWKA